MNDEQRWDWYGDDMTPKGKRMSTLKPDGKEWKVREQIIEDPVSGLTIQFELTPDGEPRLRLYGKSLKFGNRDLQFDHNGTLAGTGTFTGLCRPAWSPQDILKMPRDQRAEILNAGADAVAEHYFTEQ